MVNDFLKTRLRRCFLVRRQVSFAAHINGIQPSIRPRPHDSEFVGGSRLKSLDGLQVRSGSKQAARSELVLNWTIASSGNCLFKSVATTCTRAVSPVKASAKAPWYSTSRPLESSSTAVARLRASAG